MHILQVNIAPPLPEIPMEVSSKKKNNEINILYYIIIIKRHRYS